MTVERGADGVAGVLAAHADFGLWGGQFGCKCGAEFTDTRDRRTHVAEQVTAWLGEQLAAAEMREAVRDAIADCEGWQAGMWPWTAEANDALTAVAERLGITAEKGTP